MDLSPEGSSALSEPSTTADQLDDEGVFSGDEDGELDETSVSDTVDILL